MSRALKQFSFGAFYLFILAIIVLGVWFFYFKPAPICTDNKQNQKETGIDCGGPCIPCEVKNLNPITEEIKVFQAGEDNATLLARVSNPSENFSAAFSYQFELGGTLVGQSPDRKGREVIAPRASRYIVVAGLPIDARSIRSANLKISDLNWTSTRATPPDIKVVSETNIDQSRVTVTGAFSNESAKNLSRVNLIALLRDNNGKVINASVTRLEQVEAFSEKAFIFFFPEVEGLTKDINPQRTEIQWQLEDENF